MDFADYGAVIEQQEREQLLAHLQVKNSIDKPSAMECQECGDPISQARQDAVQGCQYCAPCQSEKE